jgi:hypothetical protein
VDRYRSILLSTILVVASEFLVLVSAYDTHWQWPFRRFHAKPPPAAAVHSQSQGRSPLDAGTNQELTILDLDSDKTVFENPNQPKSDSLATESHQHET